MIFDSTIFANQKANINLKSKYGKNFLLKLISRSSYEDENQESLHIFHYFMKLLWIPILQPLLGLSANLKLIGALVICALFFGKVEIFLNFFFEIQNFKLP